MQVVSAIFEIFKEGVPGANYIEVIDLLALASEKNELDRLIKIAKEWFFSFDLKEKHKLILSGNESDSTNGVYLCCIYGLKAASEEINTEGIQNLVNPLSEKEKTDLVEVIHKLHLKAFEFQTTLQILLGIPHEERWMVVDQVCSLTKIRMSDEDGIRFTSLNALKKMAIISPAKRKRAMEMLMDLFVAGVSRANYTSVLDFLIEKPENQLIPIIRIAKAVFFNADSSCIKVLKCLAEIRGIENFSEDRLIAFESLKNFEGIKGCDDGKKIIYKILFGHERTIPQCAFDVPGQDPELFCWMAKLIKESNDQDLQMCFQTWMKENAALVKFYHACNILLTSHQNIKKLSSQKIFVGYVTRQEKPFPKNLPGKHIPQNKTSIKNIKSAIKYFLDFKFNSDNGENVTIFQCTTTAFFI